MVVYRRTGGWTNDRTGEEPSRHDGFPSNSVVYPAMLFGASISWYHSVLKTYPFISAVSVIAIHTLYKSYDIDTHTSFSGI